MLSQFTVLLLVWPGLQSEVYINKRSANINRINKPKIFTVTDKILECCVKPDKNYMQVFCKPLRTRQLMFKLINYELFCFVIVHTFM